MSNSPEEEEEANPSPGDSPVTAAGEPGEAETDAATVDIDDADADQGEQTVSEALEAKLAAALQEKQENYERLVRTAADLDNLRKRSRREIEDARVDARAKVLRDVLPVLDNLERAIEHAESSADEGAKVIVDGVKLVLRQFEQALTKNNVKAIEAAGQPFDPNMHEAMSQIETPDTPPGCVVQVLQTGYQIGERLLRPALVVVAKAPAEPAAGPNGKSAHSSEDGDGDGDAPGEGDGQ